MFNLASKNDFLIHMSKLDKQEVEKIFTRVFSTEDGKKVLGYLRLMTFERVLPDNVSDQSLRYHEGERALLVKILRLIQR